MERPNKKCKVKHNVKHKNEVYLWRNKYVNMHDTNLFIEGNRLNRIPKNISKLCKLQSISIAVNNIVHLPSYICNLTNLRELFLYHNQITEISKCIGNLINLKVLHL